MITNVRKTSALRHASGIVVPVLPASSSRGDTASNCVETPGFGVVRGIAVCASPVAATDRGAVGVVSCCACDGALVSCPVYAGGGGLIGVEV